MGLLVCLDPFYLHWVMTPHDLSRVLARSSDSYLYKMGHDWSSIVLRMYKTFVVTIKRIIHVV